MILNNEAWVVQNKRTKQIIGDPEWSRKGGWNWRAINDPIDELIVVRFMLVPDDAGDIEPTGDNLFFNISRRDYPGCVVRWSTRRMEEYLRCYSGQEVHRFLRMAVDVEPNS